MRNLLTLFILFIAQQGSTQERDPVSKGNYKYSLSLEASQPLGEFNETHQFGISLRYVHHGGPVTKQGDRSNFIYGIGLSWLPGRTEPVNSFGYEYGDFFYTYVSGGLLYWLNKNWELNASAGPALSRYATSYRFNLYAGVQTTYVFSPALGGRAGIHLLKELDAAAVSMTTLGLVYVF